jgi:hypothetical protein
MAAEQGLSLTGPDGLLKQFTKTVLETALNKEMTEHLGHEKNQAEPDRASSTRPGRDGQCRFPSVRSTARPPGASLSRLLPTGVLASGWCMSNAGDSERIRGIEVKL